MLYIDNENKIYFSEIKEYFQEVKSSYVNSNYRSANVMLYSILICDLILKLDELYVSHDDKIAKNILDDIGRERENSNRKSSWEKTLVDEIKKKTNLIDEVSYIYISHLYDIRNLSAHPILNSNNKLVSPSKEETISNILNIVNKVLILPPIFTKSIIESLTENLVEVSPLYINSQEELTNYLNRKYYDRLTLELKKNLHKKLWKFSFNMSKDDDCNKNRKINRMALLALESDVELDVVSIIKNNESSYQIGISDLCTSSFISYLSLNRNVYKVLDKHTTEIVESRINDSDSAKLLSWFKYDSIDEFTKYIMSLDYINVENYCIDKMENYLLLNGKLHELIDIFISFYKYSNTFDKADNLFDNYIHRSLNLFTKEQMIELIKVTIKNNQIYGRAKSIRSNTIIINEILKKYDITEITIPESFEYNKEIKTELILEVNDDPF